VHIKSLTSMVKVHLILKDKVTLKNNLRLSYSKFMSDAFKSTSMELVSVMS